MLMDKNHHAYLLEGERKETLAGLFARIKEEWGIERKANPDFFVLESETLSIDEARALKESATTKPFLNKKIFVIAANFMGHEAQNALLKVFEEPASDTYFFVIVPNKEILLPTVRSRLLPISLAERSKGVDSPEALKFLQSSPEGRLKILGGFLTQESETKKSDLIDFLSEVEKIMSADFRGRKSAAELEELLRLKKYLFDRSPSVKMIGEYLALRLPKLG